jgi:hypothetical protein
VRPTYFTDRNLGRQFPALLRAAGLDVVAHDDRFAQDTPDDVWLPEVAREGWVVLTRDKQIRWKANERDAVMEHGVALFALSGSGRTPELADLVIATVPVIERFLARHPRPFLAKILAPTPGRRSAPRGRPGPQPGSVTLWLTEAQWRAER